MMKFQAKRVTLDVALVQLDGMERTLSAPPLNAQQSAELLDRLIREDDEFDSSHNKAEAIYGEMTNHYDRQLAAIYGTEEGYWSANFDGTTVANVKRYVIDELLGMKKKE